MLPDFLVIGAQKSGTTWLYRNLNNHPEIWLPPEKEIHFFDFPPIIPFYFTLFSKVRSIRHWGKNRMVRDFNKVVAGDQTLSWYFRYYFFFRTKRWYRSLFTPLENQIAGEITPRYAILNKKSVKKVHEVLPRAKIIYLLRNPIDRMWSDLAMYHRPQFGRAHSGSMDKKRIIKFLNNPKHLASSKYLSNLGRWELYYPESQVLVVFQDQIREDPGSLLQKVSQFLGVNHFDYHHSELINKKINSHSYPDIPDEYAKLLAETFIDEIEQLHHRFNNSYTQEWLKVARAILDKV